jgi:Bacteriophage Lambda NinG protein
MKRGTFKSPTKEKLAELQAKKLERVKLKQATRSHTIKSKAIKPKKREKTQAQLKKDLDTVFSLYVRAIYPKVCYTCEKPAERLQCGHYISRQYLVTRWSIDNCRPQCWGCNGYGKGQPLIFEEKLKQEYGNDFVENMKASRHQMLKLDRNWYKEQIEVYKVALENL